MNSTRLAGIAVLIGLIFMPPAFSAGADKQQPPILTPKPSPKPRRS
ncbi:MAG: hypothetical protein N2689_15505 [Verrucomicrobiae bacterium]|nr:hypothetical protein [Verrucomicrobiae bacterium]